MDKLYSKKILFAKAAFSVFLAPINIVLSAVLSIENAFVYIIFSTVPVGCLFTVPFWFSLLHIKKYRVKGIGSYILYDFVFCVFPAVFGVLFSEIIYTVIYEKTIATGMMTIIFSAIFILSASVFWLLYYILSHKK